MFFNFVQAFTHTKQYSIELWSTPTVETIILDELLISLQGYSRILYNLWAELPKELFTSLLANLQTWKQKVQRCKSYTRTNERIMLLLLLNAFSYLPFKELTFFISNQ